MSIAVRLIGSLACSLAIATPIGWAAAPAMAAAPAVRATPAFAAGPVKTERYQVNFVRLGSNNLNGLLYEPLQPGPNARIGLVYTYPRPWFDASPAVELANRGYRVLLVRSYLQSRRGEAESPLDGFEGTSAGINYLRTLPGVQRVVAMGWGTGARMLAGYANIAENGAAACQGKAVLYPCATEDASGLAKADGIVLFDPGPGALSTGSNMDPAFLGSARSRADLDMYAAANGFDAKSGTANYSAEFKQRFFAAQSARNNELIDRALARMKLIQQGQGEFADDEPFTVPGAVNVNSGASLHRPDLSLLSRTKRPHLLLKADGTAPTVIVHSIRAPTGAQDARNVGACCGDINYSVRRFLANNAVRTTKDYALTENDIVGVDWKTSNASTPANAAGITVPTLVTTTTCFQFVVISEIVFDHLASKDKTYVAIEGSEHFFGPCKPEYGDTKKRTFDFVDAWLAKPGRFP